MSSDPQLVKGTVRMLILRLLEKGPMYGYRMIQDLRERSEGYFDLGEGALYPLLHEMEEAGILRARWEQQQGRPSRRYYSLSARGRTELARRLAEWQRFAHAIRTVLEASHEAA